LQQRQQNKIQHNIEIWATQTGQTGDERRCSRNDAVKASAFYKWNTFISTIGIY
jgi:hypothetical protein